MGGTSYPAGWTWYLPSPPLQSPHIVQLQVLICQFIYIPCKHHPETLEAPEIEACPNTPSPLNAGSQLRPKLWR